MKPKIAETSNVRNLFLALNALSERQERIAIVAGASGLGKTTALIHCQNHSNAAVVQASPTWSPRWLLANLCEQLSIRAGGQAQPMFEAIIKQLKVSRVPIFLDEANFIVECLDARQILGILGTLYRIHDEAGVPIILFGLSSFPRYLKDRAARNETVDAFTQRCVKWIDFTACNLADARLVADARCEVQIGDALLEAIVKETDGSYRKLIARLTEVERDAIAQGWDAIDQPQLEALTKQRRAA